MMMRKFHKVYGQAALALYFSQVFLSSQALTGLPAAQAETAPTIPSLAKTAQILGINERALVAINRGDWATAEEKLTEITKESATVTHNNAWLAFCFLYQSKRKELQILSDHLATTDIAADPKSPVLLVTVLNLVAQNKLTEAQDILQSNKALLKDDQLASFVTAAIALKQGKASEAAQLCEALLKVAPQFAWGYRTLGFILEKNLKNKPAAELAYQQALKIEPACKDATDLLCNLRLSQNNFDGAIEVAQAAIKNNPNDSANQLRLTQIYIQQWRLKEAQIPLQKAIKLAPQDASLYRTKSTIYRHQKNYLEAIKAQQQAVDLSQNKASDLVELASLEDLAGKQSEAIDHLKEAIKADPQHNQTALTKMVDLLKAEQKWDELAVFYRDLLKSDQKHTTYIIGLAQALKAGGHPDEAIEQYKEAANLDQADPIPHREIAAIQVERHNFGEAAKSLTRALNINAGSLQDLIALGDAYAKNRDYVQAETAYMTGLALQQLGQVTGSEKNISSFDIMRSLAAVLMQENRYSEAAANLEALKVDKNSPNRLLDDYNFCRAAAMHDRSKTALETLIKAYDVLPAQTRQQEQLSFIQTLVLLHQYDQALSYINKIPESELNREAKLLIEKALAELGINDKNALNTAKLALEQTTTDPEAAALAYAAMAEVELAQANSASAEKMLDKALELDPKAFSAITAKALLLFNNKQYGAAEAQCHRIQEINPYSWEAYFILAKISDARDKTREALELAQKAEELYPGNLTCRQLCLNLYRKLKLYKEASDEENILLHLQRTSLP